MEIMCHRKNRDPICGAKIAFPMNLVGPNCCSARRRGSAAQPDCKRFKDFS